jgi:RNA polymerase sigma-70 factor, ECF subfamily
MFGQIEESWKASKGGNAGFVGLRLPEVVRTTGAEGLPDLSGPGGEAETGTEVLADSVESGLTDATNEAPLSEGAESASSTSDIESESEDEKLVAMARLGDRNAFNALILKHYTTCLKRATFMIRNRSDAEDEVQNACWKAFQRLEQYRGEGTFSAWLSRIVENQCLMRIREERKSSFVYLDESTESNVRLELVGQRANPEDELGEQQVVKLIRREISLIPPLLRNVMLLRDVEQLPMPDVASRLGVSVPAAKSRLMRARAELRLRVAKHCGPKGCATLTHRSRYKQAAYLRAS